jgi:hypothetical protein
VPGVTPERAPLADLVRRYLYLVGDGEALGEGDAGGAGGVDEGEADGDAEGVGDADGLGLADGDGREGPAGTLGSGLSGGLGGVGAAPDSSRRIASALTTSAVGTASMSAPLDGRIPVLWAEFR